MSNVTPFVVGLGGGLMLWQLTRSKPTTETSLRNATGACVIVLDPGGIAVDGERVDVAEAVRRAQLAGLALVTVVPDAPAATCAALFASLHDAAVPTHARTQVASPRNGGDRRTDFTLRTYPHGSTSPSIERYFRTEAPISWGEARDRLAAAGVLDLTLAGRTSQPGGWMLSIDKSYFHAELAEPLPGAPRNSYISTTFTLALYPEGVGGPKTTRWFSSNAPVTWDDAAERLADAGIIDPSVTLATQPGYWILVSAPGPFEVAKAEPLPARKKGRRNTESSTAFTLVTYPDGARGSRKTTRWFRTDAPMTWESARDQLAASGALDKIAISPNGPGYWKLVTDRRVFMPSRAQPMPDGPRDAAPKPQQFTLEGGRTIRRDGEAIVRLERVDLGNERYVLSPFETDQLTARIVRLLNKHGSAVMADHPIIMFLLGGGLAAGAVALLDRRASKKTPPPSAVTQPASSPPQKVGAPITWMVPVPTLGDRRAVVSNKFAGAKHLGVDLMFQRHDANDLATVYRAGTPNGTKLFFMPDDVAALAAAAGVVTFAAMTPIGNALIIQHPNGWTTYYAHLASLAVHKGQTVAAGDTLGTIGASPADAEHLKHLHFELWTSRVRSAAVDPAPYLAAWPRVTLPWSSPALVASNTPRNGAMSAYRPVGDRGEPYPDWVRALRGQAGVYVIRDASTHECLYVGSSSTQLYDTLTRHFQTWRRYKGFWKGQYAEGADPGLTYPRGDVEVAVRLTSPNAALDTEMRLIARLRPRDNQIGQPDAAADESIPF